LLSSKEYFGEFYTLRTQTLGLTSYVVFEVSTAVIIWIVAFWVMTLCNLAINNISMEFAVSIFMAEVKWKQQIPMKLITYDVARCHNRQLKFILDLWFSQRWL
jgi:hypothetical protein